MYEATKILLYSLVFIFIATIVVTYLTLKNKSHNIKVFIEIFASLSLVLTAVFYYSLIRQDELFDFLDNAEQYVGAWLRTHTRSPTSK